MPNVQCPIKKRAIAMLKKMRVFKPCIVCGEQVHHNVAKRCVKCANLHKALISSAKTDLRLKNTKFKKYLKLKCGLEVLNNTFGQELFSPGKVWNSGRAV